MSPAAMPPEGPGAQIFVVADVEGTLSTGEMWRGIGRYLAAHGRAMRWRWFLAVNLPRVLWVRMGFGSPQRFKNLWLARQVRLLRGSTPEEIRRMAEWVVEHEIWPNRRMSVLAELAAHDAQGHRVLLASGMYPPVLDAIARRMDFGPVEYVGTPLEFEGGRFTGRFAGPVCVAGEKAVRVQERTAGCLVLAAYGDTAADIRMLELGRDPVAVVPDPGLAQGARERGWRIIPA
jgi:phosphoserine phosphatase